jgi:hypothetical protein
MAPAASAVMPARYWRQREARLKAAATAQWRARNAPTAVGIVICTAQLNLTHSAALLRSSDRKPMPPRSAKKSDTISVLAARCTAQGVLLSASRAGSAREACAAARVCGVTQLREWCSPGGAHDAHRQARPGGRARACPPPPGGGARSQCRGRWRRTAGKAQRRVSAATRPRVWENPNSIARTQRRSAGPRRPAQPARRSPAHGVRQAHGATPAQRAPHTHLGQTR